jgi:CTP synthase
MQNNQAPEIKYIFVTGGVVSGIGKGICAASIGYILKSSGYNVDALKMDPYLNVDPGTMSPYEHGEVYVLEDGKETDLDLGNYERFLNINLDKNSSVSSGTIYTDILKKEREGAYLGKTVQLIPHVTNYIKEKFLYTKDGIDIKIIEIGGSTGDIEAEVFLESLRQFKLEHKDVLHIHLGFLPFLTVVGEYKSKPLQNSVKELLRLGLQPDVLVLRYEPNKCIELSDNIIEKVALHTNLSLDSIIKLPDLSTIYQSPVYLTHNTDIVKRLSRFLKYDIKPNLNNFYLNANKQFEKRIRIALIAKYSGLSDSYLSVIESIKIAAVYNQVNVEIQILDSEKDDLLEIMDGFDGFIVPGGFGKRGLEEKIKAIHQIRINQKPFLGICLGMQLSVIEFLRNECCIDKAVSREMLDDQDTDTYEICVDYMPEQSKITNKGGTMRLGSYLCHLEKESIAMRQFNAPTILERHRHRLEVQNQFVSILEKHGMKISGKYLYDKDYLVEIIELNQNLHPYFIAIQSHPEFLSRPDAPHPLFDGLIKACLK